MVIAHRQNTITLAKKIAYIAHQGQYRRDGITPYINHPKDVASRVTGWDEKCVAWLHDVLEDSDYTANDLRRTGMPTHIIDAVVAITKINNDSYHKGYLKRIADNPLATLVKIADIASNLDDDPTEKQVEKYKKALNYFKDNKYGKVI